MNKKLQDYMQKETYDKRDFVIQQILSTHSKTHLLQLERALRKLKGALYKSWAQELPLCDLYESINFSLSLITEDDEEVHDNTLLR